MLIREATVADAPGIGKVQVDTWRTTYAGIVPEAELEALSYEDKQRFWERVITYPGNPTFVYVAQDNEGQIVGFTSGGQAMKPELGYEGELYTIYVLREFQGKGAGRELFRVAVQRFMERGFRSMLLWVFVDNPSRRFYEAMGGQVVAHDHFELGGATIQEVAYGWPDLSALRFDRSDGA